MGACFLCRCRKRGSRKGLPPRGMCERLYIALDRVDSKAEGQHVAGCKRFRIHLPQPHPRRVAVGELDAGGLQSDADGVQCTRPPPMIASGYT